MQSLTLNDQSEMPILGFGTYQLSGNECRDAVQRALAVGYRHIDTADRYHNHQNIAQALVDSKIPRQEIFITSKVWFTDLAHNDVLAACKRFLNELKTPYLDLLLIHWPNRKIPLSETFEALQELKRDGLVKSFGVSNFTIHHIQDLLSAGYRADVNQVEFHPSLNQTHLKKFCDDQKITVTAYSPLAQGYDLELELIKKIAKENWASGSQVILKWLMNKGIAVIPRSLKQEHIEANFKALELKLSDEDMKLIDDIGGHHRVIYPEFSDFAY